ncbi:hypothetical protein FHR81_002589 [Actinoalloteichus hoggarensis]|nr:hypothetical protein [Actinoalloteichus hoggarensis]
MVGDDGGQAVRTDEQSVAHRDVQEEQVRLGFRAAALQGAHHDRPSGVVFGLRLRQPARVDQGLDQGVIARDLPEHASRVAVGPGITDVRDAESGAVPGQRRQGRAHARRLRPRLAEGVQSGEGVGHAVREHAQQVSPWARIGQARVELVERGHDDRAGDLAVGMAAHSVGDREQPRARVRRVLIDGASPSRIGSARVREPPPITVSHALQ